MSIKKVAVLDDYQGVSKSYFQPLGDAGYDITIFADTLLPYNHPDTPQDAKDALVKRLEPFPVICTMRERTPIPGDLVAKLPHLKLLLTTGARNASIDVKACSDRGVPVAGTTSARVSPDQTTQHGVALILGLARNLAHDDAMMKAGGWQTTTVTSLSGKVFGTVGLGRLGSAVAKIMKVAFGMRVISWSPNLTQEKADAQAKAAGLAVGDERGNKSFEAVSREELFSNADVVSVHLVLSDRSRDLINKDDFGRMKKSALFVNTSRGPIANEDDLLEVAKKGTIRGIALDVYGIEPLPKDSGWRNPRWGQDGTSHVLLSPHMGYVEANDLGVMYQQQVENILRWEKGEALSTVYKDTGY
ncbi:D-3-phosphoglycerate dehydrogenase [Pseudomassariella vexata]|uniref:D-3-phosphoglycerate dehydrogenase n=1 Tax=Pseudomassariella vexata TaxID=1141098 RepID=A0A1Y2D9C1_9PEZI|nr:D-3-phosphoglycerate dehydrogenase [Pseudomassariella vexata]ORY55861.1 D-3-phosphoglycerate dehydrogenase [Pseudomassariella vexata]